MMIISTSLMIVQPTLLMGDRDMHWLKKKTAEGIMIFSCVSKIKGKKILLQDGFTQCRNRLYFRNEDQLVHYNRKMKIWIMEF